MEAIAGRKQVMPLFAKANGLAYVKSPISNQFNVEILRMGDRVLMKQMTIKQAVDEATKAVQKALDDFWDTQK